jgi:hypothetical protein
MDLFVSFTTGISELGTTCIIIAASIRNIQMMEVSSLTLAGRSFVSLIVKSPAPKLASKMNGIFVLGDDTVPA